MRAAELVAVSVIAKIAGKGSRSETVRVSVDWRSTVVR
jgi:hypothetical protein